jgi:hypothetical protein
MRKNEHNLFNAMMLAIQGNPIMPSDLLPE